MVWTRRASAAIASPASSSSRSPGTTSSAGTIDDLAAAAHARVGRGELLQRVERGLGAALLVVPEEGVEDDDEQDGDRVAEARQEAAHRGRP
jgi:hypothetical protein